MDAQYRELGAMKLTPSSSPARSPAVSVVDHDDPQWANQRDDADADMEQDGGLEGGLTQVEGSPLVNTDADTNYVETGDGGGSIRLRVQAPQSQAIPSAHTLSRALQRGQYTLDKALMLQQSLAQFLKELREEDATAALIQKPEQQDQEMELL